MKHAVTAVDGTAARSPERPSNQVSERFRWFINERLELIERWLGGAGPNLETTRWPVPSKNGRQTSITFAELIYEYHRTHLAHGEPLLPGFELRPSAWMITNGTATVPTYLPWALLACVVLAPVNADQRIAERNELYLNLQDQRYYVDEWWGRQHDFEKLPFPELIRVHMDWGDWIDPSTSASAGAPASTSGPDPFSPVREPRLDPVPRTAKSAWSRSPWPALMSEERTSLPVVNSWVSRARTRHLPFTDLLAQPG